MNMQFKWTLLVIVTGMGLGLVTACTSGQAVGVNTTATRPSSHFGASSNTSQANSTGTGGGANSSASTQQGLPATSSLGINPPRHVVIVIEENHSYREIAGNQQAPYINSLMQAGANLTNYHGVEHPSEPNYLDLFSGSNQGVTNDSCPHTFDTQNLASNLLASGQTFIGYSEDLPKTGYTGCSNKMASWMPGATYARKHNPWVNFTNVPPSVNQPLTVFPKDYNQLPTVSIVIPNLNHDMHNGSIQAGDNWLKTHLSSYAEWAMTHNSLLVVTFDEDDQSASNQIPTVLVGQMVKPGAYNTSWNHFSLLRTIEDFYHLPYAGKSASSKPIQTVWRA